MDQWRWQTMLRPSTLERGVPVRGGGPEPFAPLRGRAAPVDLIEPDSEHARLVWPNIEQAQPSPTLEAALRSFIELDQAPDTALVEFASTYGPVLSEQSAGEPGSTPSGGVSEPILAWRLVARGMNALLALAPAVRHDRSTESHLWVDALTAVAGLGWLASGATSRERPTDDALAIAATTNRQLGWHGWIPAADRMLFEQVVRRMLALAGVEPGFSLFNGEADPARYVIPTMAVPTQTAPPTVPRFVVGMAPVLAVAMVLAIEANEYFPCSWCGRAARVQQRPPRGRRPWYGDHDICRAAARAVALRQADERRRHGRHRRDHTAST